MTGGKEGTTRSKIISPLEVDDMNTATRIGGSGGVVDAMIQQQQQQQQASGSGEMEPLQGGGDSNHGNGNNNNNNISTITATLGKDDRGQIVYREINNDDMYRNGGISIVYHDSTESSSNGMGGMGGMLDKNDMMMLDDDIRKYQSYRHRIYEWLYPPDIPRTCQLLRIENIAVPACYLLVGLLQGLSSTLINVFPLDIGATEAQQTTISSIRSLPASCKLLFGFLSDNVSWLGYRRKPYMMIGWLMSGISMMTLLFLSNVNVRTHNAGCFGDQTSTVYGNITNTADAPAEDDNDYDDGNDDTTETDDTTTTPSIPDDAPSILFLSICLLGFGTGFWMADVMGDSIVAEKAKFEPEHTRGHVQSTCYAYRFFGMMIAAPFGTWLYATGGPVYIVSLLCILPLTILPAVYMLKEERYANVKSTTEHCYEIWNTVCSRAVWQPMGFVYLYNVMQVGNSAWREFLVSVLKFTTCQLNLILIVALVLLYVGIMTYKYNLIHWSWRTVFIICTIFSGILTIPQIMLILQTPLPFGMSPFWFALGDDAVAEFVGGIQFLPTTIMMVHLCPVGSEGATYAMFTTVHNSALALSSALSTMLLGIWDVSKTTIMSGDLNGFLKLTLFTTAIQMSAILFVGWLPRYKEDLQQLKMEKKSIVGGSIFLTITFFSVLYAFIIGLLNIMKPGWMDES